MQELLFQNGLITWTDSGIPSFWIATATFSVLLGLYLRSKLPKKQAPIILKPYVPIPPEDVHYVTRTLAELKQYLLIRYAPHHVQAHTALEVGQYITSPELKDILIELENTEYAGKLLTYQERLELNERIGKDSEIRT